MSDQNPQQRYTKQFMKGFTIVGVTLASMKAVEPYADAVAAESLQYISFAALLVMSYGLYLAVTSPLAVQAMEGLQARLYGGEDSA